MAVIKSAKNVTCALSVALAITGASIAGGMSPITTAATAIQKARHVCLLKEKPLPGRWQAVLVND